MPRDEPTGDVREQLADAAERAGADSDPEVRAPLRPSAVIRALKPPTAPTFSDEGTQDDHTDSVLELAEIAGLGDHSQRFVAEAEVGRGGMGVVVRAWDTELRRRVALKWLRDDITVGRRQLLRFLAEAQLTAQLDHPGIVPVHDIGVTREGRIYYVMKLVDGRTLNELIAEQRSGVAGGWTTRALVDAMLRAMDAVQYAHDRGVVHRDLKPSNLILGEYGEVWVVDWGIAHVVVENELDVASGRQAETMPGSMIGTPSYASPEQLVGDPVDFRSDVWSLGAVLHEILTGSPPWPGLKGPARVTALLRGPADPRKAADDVPEGLARIVMNATRSDPRDRYASVRVMADAMRHWLERERARERDLAGWVKRHLHLSALAVDARAVRISDALSHLVTLTELLFAGEAGTEAVDRWLGEAGFAIDADGYYQPASLPLSIRAGTAPADALSWCWPPSRADDPVAKAHMHALRGIGPTLRDMADRVAEVSFWYFADARNVALVFPADDMVGAVPSEFDFLSYPAFVAASPDQNPERTLRTTPPHVDYGNKGLITSMTRPVYVNGTFVGAWAADVPLAVLHKDVQVAEDERELTFILDRAGLVVAHPRDRTLQAVDKGAVFDTHLVDLGGALATLDPAAMFARGRGSERVHTGDGRELIVRFQSAPQLGWLLCHASKGAA